MLTQLAKDVIRWIILLVIGITSFGAALFVLYRDEHASSGALYRNDPVLAIKYPVRQLVRHHADVIVAELDGGSAEPKSATRLGYRTNRLRKKFLLVGRKC